METSGSVAKCRLFSQAMVDPARIMTWQFFLLHRCSQYKRVVPSWMKTERINSWRNKIAYPPDKTPTKFRCQTVSQSRSSSLEVIL